MKKSLTLLMLPLILLALCAPLLAAAEVEATEPPTAIVSMDAAVDTTVTVSTATSLTGGIDFTPLFQALIGVLALIVTTYLIPWIKGKTTAAQRDKMDYWTKIAVVAAEKAYGSGNGPEKLKSATNFLATKGIIIDPVVVDAWIKLLFESAKPPNTTT